MAAENQYLTGKLILDSGKLKGSFFDHSVVFICKHDETGAFGIVLNRPTKHSLGSVVGDQLYGALADIPLYLGGPVQPQLVTFLKQTEFDPENEILPWVTLSHSLDEVKDYFLMEEAPKSVRVFAGYAGWTAGQLETEMKGGFWILHPAKQEIVFAKHPDKRLWKTLLKSKGGLYRLMADSPEDPSMN